MECRPYCNATNFIGGNVLYISLFLYFIEKLSRPAGITVNEMINPRF